MASKVRSGILRIRRPGQPTRKDGRRRARLTCANGHVWTIESAYLSMEGDDERWRRRNCPHCEHRPLAVMVLQGGRSVQEAIFRWRIKVFERWYVPPRDRKAEKAALARLHQCLHGGGGRPILTRAKTNAKPKRR